MQPELVKGGGLGGREQRARRHQVGSGRRAAQRIASWGQVLFWQSLRMPGWHPVSGDSGV